MRFHVAGVDRSRQREHAFGRQSIEHVGPQPAPGPAVEAVVDRRGRAVFGWAVLPATAFLQYVQDAADHSAIIDPARARLVLRKVRLDRRPHASSSSQKSLLIIASVTQRRHGN